MASTSDVENPTLSGINYIDALVNNVPLWGLVTPSGNTIKYTFSITEGNEDGQAGQLAFNATQAGYARAALQYISTLTGVHFTETNNGTEAQVHLAYVNIDGADTTGVTDLAISYLPGPNNTLSSYSASAYVYLDDAEWMFQNSSLQPGGQGYQTLLHELGHMLGLKHPFEGAIQLPSTQDLTSNTLMSYTAGHGEPFSSFRQDDIAALNWIYGGDGLGGALGNDSVGGGRYVTGTRSGDTMTGTSANDALEGDGGDDVIDGGAGTDTAVYNGSHSAYTVLVLAGGSLRVSDSSGADGIDTLTNIEILRFSDGSFPVSALIDSSAPAAPTLTVPTNGSIYVAGNTPVLSGTAEAGASVQLFSGSVSLGSATADASGNWLLTSPTLADGAYSLTAKATDAAGNVSAASSALGFSVDTHAPAAPTLGLGNATAGVVNGNQAAFSGSGEAGARIAIIEGAVTLGTATVAGNGSWSLTSKALGDGSYSVVAKATDAAGNVSDASAIQAFTVASKLNRLGTAQDDVLSGSAGDNHIDGGAGNDTVSYASARSNYTITKVANGLLVHDQVGGDGSDLLVNVETLQFADASLPLAYDEVVQELYLAYFGRAADYSGRAAFEAQLAQIGAPHDIAGLSAAYDSNAAVKALVDSFGSSAESQRLYSGDSRAFVSAIFHNLLGRDPAATGLAFWSGAIDDGSLTRAHASLAILVGALGNVTAQGLRDGTLINNKAAIASDFTFVLATPAAESSYSGATAAGTVRSMISTVTASTDVDAFQGTVASTAATLQSGNGGTAVAADIAHGSIAVELVGVSHAAHLFQLA